MWCRRDRRCWGSSESFPEHEVLPYPQGLEPTPACGTGRGVEEPAVPTLRVWRGAVIWPHLRPTPFAHL